MPGLACSGKACFQAVQPQALPPCLIAQLSNLWPVIVSIFNLDILSDAWLSLSPLLSIIQRVDSALF
jgi:hypothetical protein